MTEDEKKDLQEELGKAKAILVVKKSEGGKMLIDNLKESIERTIEMLINGYKTASHIELVSLIAILEANKTLLNKINASEESVNALKEELGDKK